MELVYTCKGCNKYRKLDSDAKTREILAEFAGSKDFEVNCPFCNVNQNVNVNFITAIKTTFEKWSPFIYWKLSLIVLLFFFTGSLAFIALLISFIIPIYIYNKLESEIKEFNSKRI